MEEHFFEIDKDGKFNMILSLQECLHGIEVRYNKICAENVKLKNENEKLKNGYFELEYIKKCKDEIQELNEILSQKHFFDISEDEQQRINDWCKKHDEEKHGADYKNNKFRYSGAIGGAYTYCFTPTSIGIIGAIKCSCGDKYIFREI